MRKTLIVILFLSSITLSQVTEEEQTKIILANYVIQLDKMVKLNVNLTNSIDALISELRAIKEPSTELIVILEKYGIYQAED